MVWTASSGQTLKMILNYYGTFSIIIKLYCTTQVLNRSHLCGKIWRICGENVNIYFFIIEFEQHSPSRIQLFPILLKLNMISHNDVLYWKNTACLYLAGNLRGTSDYLKTFIQKAGHVNQALVQCWANLFEVAPTLRRCLRGENSDKW